MTLVARLALAAIACSTILPQGASAQSKPLIWFDEERQAVGIDPFAETWGLPPVDLDFNDQHAAAATIRRELTTPALGLTVEPGVFDTRELYCPGIDWRATLSLFGWADRLGSLAPVTGYDDTVTKLLYYGYPAATDKVQFFTDAWDVAAGLTAIYVRPLGADGAPVPVTRAIAEGAWYRVGAENAWLPLPFPAAPPPVAASMKITPRTLNLKSKGQWVTVRLVLPEGFPVETVDVASLRLALTSSQRDAAGALQQAMRHESGTLRVTHDDGLMVKFNRSDLEATVFPGDASLTLTGAFLDGTRFVATDTIAVIP
jgi:hypothetical protein